MRRYNSGTGRLRIGQPLSLLTRRLINTVSNAVSNSRISKPSNSPLGNGIGISITKTWRHSRLKVLGASLLTAIATIALAIPALTNPSSAYTADAFVMVVKTDNPGTSNATSFTIPTTGTGYSYNVDCDDDGTPEVTARTTSYTCAYATAGTYTIAITGTFPRIYFNESGDTQKLLEVQQWGTGAWTSMVDAFHGCTNMHVTATDAPNLTGVTSTEDMFRDAINMNENINHWDTGTVTNMRGMFWHASAFNQPLDSWNTSTVTDMSQMFGAAAAFNQPLNTWNTAAVTNVSEMFRTAIAFNQPLTDWNTSAVTNMSSMFYGASAFNQPIDGWDTSRVTTMSFMFNYATSFNQPLNNWSTISLISLAGMFQGARSFNQPLSNWQTNAVTNMSQMFSQAASFDQPLDTWNTSAVTNMSSMFSGARVFDQDLTSWDTSKVTNMSSMFSSASAFNQPLASWNTSAVTNMSSMFSGARVFDQDLTGWDTSAVTTMYGMFSGATSFDQPLGAWDISSVTATNYMFSGASAFNQPLTSWNTSAVTNMYGMFRDATAFNQPLLGWNIGAVLYMGEMLNNSGYTTATYEETLAHLVSQAVQPNVALGAVGITYCDDTAHLVLTSAPNNWNITDGGFCPPVITSPTSLAIVSTGTPIISGIAKPSRIVDVDLDGTDYDTIANTDGAYSFTVPTALAIGWHMVTLRSTDQAGNLGAPTSLSFYVHLGGTVSLSGSVQTPTLTWPTAPNTGVAASWQQAAVGDTSFPARGSFGTAELNGKLWVIGGQGTSSRLNDVWSSTDGINWTQELANAPWSARNAHTVTSFNGKLWVMGGQTGGSATRLNDVWSSPDGVNWTLELANAPWSARSAHEVVVHDNKLWTIGGVDTTDADLTDVWSSPDGITWTQATGSANWPSRRGFGVASFNNKLWIMGGLVNDWGTFESDVWSSTDGITWTEETSSAAWPVRASHQVEVFDGKLWVLGGSADDWDSEYSDVWFSENGKDWIRTTEAADWEARRGHSSAVFDNKLWVLGGRVGQYWTLSNDVWSAAIPLVTYTVCWDTVEGGCAHTATTDGTPSFTIPNNLAIGTWYFKVQATDPQGKPLGSYTSSAYALTKLAPVTSPITNAPTLNPLTKQASSTVLPAALTGATLGISSYQCTTHQPSIALYEPGNLQAPDTNVTLLGGIGFSLNCANNGDSADVAITLGTGYRDTAKLRAYKQSGNSLVDITDQVQFTTAITANNTWQTTISYQLVDGSTLDEDGTANGTIVDPIYIGTLPGAEEMLAATGVSIWLVGGGGVVAIAAGLTVAMFSLRPKRHRRQLAHLY